MSLGISLLHLGGLRVGNIKPFWYLYRLAVHPFFCIIPQLLCICQCAYLMKLHVWLVLLNWFRIFVLLIRNNRNVSVNALVNNWISFTIILLIDNKYAFECFLFRLAQLGQKNNWKYNGWDLDLEANQSTVTIQGPFLNIKSIYVFVSKSFLIFNYPFTFIDLNIYYH